MTELPASWTDELLAVATAFSRARTPHEVGEAAVTLGSRALGAVSAAIWLDSRDRAQPELLAARGIDASEPRGLERLAAAHDVLTVQGAADGGPAAADARCEPGSRSSIGAPPSPRDERTVLCVPLIGDQVAGRLGFVFEGPADIPAEARSFAQALAMLCAQALERARLLGAEQQARRRLRILAEVTEAFGAPDVSAPGLLEIAARKASAAVGDGAFVRLLDPDGAWLEPRATAGERGARERVRRLAGDREALERLVDWPALGRGETVVEASAPRAILAAPLQIKGRALGALVVLRSQPHEPYREEDRLLVEGIASRVASALEKTRLHEEVVRSQRLSEELLAREQQARREAETASRAKDEFLAMLGHELRNPLSPILTALDLMRMRGDAFGHERTLILRQVQHLVRLVDDLLDVSRITRGKVALKRRLLDLHEVVSASIEMVSPILEARRHRLVREGRAGLVVEGDPDRLAQAVANLLTNAAKYTEPGGTVAVSAERDGPWAVVRVRDSGMGIAPELLGRVFDLFVQGQRALDRSQGGLGLGLAIARSLIDLHGGDIAAESEGPGRGSLFTIRLPVCLREVPAPLPAASPAQARAGARTGHRVLVVDDNQEAADALVEALDARGHAVLAAYDGPSALAAAARTRPDAAFLDIGLPVMDGYELARRMRELLGPSVKLVALTGYGQEHDRAQSRAAGFDEHLVKPVELDRITGLLRELWGARERVSIG